MAGTFKFELVSPECILLSENADQVVVPGADGDFAVLVGHAPLVSTLRPGMLDVDLPNAKRRVFVKGGFAEVEPDRLTVLGERALDVDELTGSRLTGEIEAAEAELAAAKDDHARMRAQAAIDQLRALVR
jgi:F-type H+-transporting ATPase subunit epsilon